jgi:hypothetical protein
MKLVRLFRGCSKDLSQLAPAVPSQKIHLPQAIAGCHIPLRKIEVVVVLRLNIRDSPIISPDRDRVVKTGEDEGRGFGYCRRNLLRL